MFAKLLGYGDTQRHLETENRDKPYKTQVHQCTHLQYLQTYKREISREYLVTSPEKARTNEGQKADF